MITTARNASTTRYLRRDRDAEDHGVRDVDEPCHPRLDQPPNDFDLHRGLDAGARTEESSPSSHQQSIIARVELIAEGWTAADTFSAVSGIGVVVVAVAALLVNFLPIGPAKVAARQATSAQGLAETAQRQAELAAKQVDMAQRHLDQNLNAFETSIRPLIVDAPLQRDTTRSFGPKDPNDASRPDEEHNVWWTSGSDALAQSGVRIEVRNVGNGIAFVHDAAIVVDPEHEWMMSSEPGPRMQLEASLDRKVVPAGETASFRIMVTLDQVKRYKAFRDAIGGGTAYIVIKYTDLPGRQRLLTKIHLQQITAYPPRADGSKLLTAKNVELYRCVEGWTPEEPPFATTILDE
ncbi:hypothetical protein [Nocardia sp. NBC_01327]|uniref:hypothetical protein n=1 Tax=Nocardia sp. NBC_01327 TaxID=2903593 RepID=UPI002E14A9F5|nr:hypothetical protein OG326_42920 [Nocardia sp. NBC_01327]